jgi:hypothetical protein
MPAPAPFRETIHPPAEAEAASPRGGGSGGVRRPGDMFKCALKPLAKALEDGTYGTASFTADQVRQLEAIFPDGVCDYARPDQGKPRGWHARGDGECGDADRGGRPRR